VDRAARVDCLPLGSAAVPAPLLERAATSLRLRALDLRDRVAGRGDPLVPPRRLHFVGHADSDFAGTGDEFLGHFVALGGLQRGDRVLDVGCGIGRMARPLAGFLDAAGGGAYDGFDINPGGIAWCREHYEREHPEFAFVVADIFNTAYNPGGTQAAADFTFPYDDGTFGFTLATSVFTHLVEDAAERYVAEAARTLRDGGTLFATWLLLDDDSRAAVRAGRAALPFRIGAEGSAPEVSAVIDPAVPEDAIAFDRSWLAGTAARHGLTITAIHDGSWRGGAGPTYQDIVVATKGTPTT
jgi:SAM-dependent methyltransferase